jgi:hypothetical protein
MSSSSVFKTRCDAAQLCGELNLKGLHLCLFHILFDAKDALQILELIDFFFALTWISLINHANQYISSNA